MSNSRHLEKADEMGWTSLAEELGTEPSLPGDWKTRRMPR